MNAALKDVVAGKLVLLPLAVGAVAILAGRVGTGAVLALFLAAAGWALAQRRGRDPAGFAAESAAFGLFLMAWLAHWPFARARPMAALEACVALVMGAGVAFGRPWTMSIAGRIRCSELPPGALMLRIHKSVSTVWAVAFALLALRAARAWPMRVQWVIVALGAAASVALPLLMVRRTASRRMRGANAWEPLMSAAQAGTTDADVVVVGAGLGGLTAAALLAKAGLRVVVCEQHRVPGGFAHAWIRVAPGEPGRPVFRFDGGVHDISGIGKGGPVHGLLEHLGITGDVAWLPIRHGIASEAGRCVEVPRAWDAYVEELCQRFPAEAQGIRRALADIRSIFDAMYALGATRHGVPSAPRSMRELMEFGRRHPLAAAWLDQPFDTFLRQRVRDPGARRAIASLAGYVTDRPSSLAVAAMVPLFGYQIHGGAYPEGGSGRLAHALAGCVARHGGEVRLRTRVARVRVVEGRAAGVVLADGTELRARAVVMNADFLSAARALLPASALPRQFMDEAARTRAACSASSVHLGLRGEWPDALPSLIQVETPQGSAVLSLTSRADPSAAPPGYSTLEIVRLVSADEARTWAAPDGMRMSAWRRDASYTQRKRSAGDALIDAAEQVLPGLRERIVLRSDASPITYQRYDLSTDGSIYGCEGAARGRDVRGPLPGLVFAGAVTHGPGVEAVMISGALAAEALRPGILDDGALARVDARVWARGLSAGATA